MTDTIHTGGEAAVVAAAGAAAAAVVPKRGSDASVSEAAVRQTVPEREPPSPEGRRVMSLAPRPPAEFTPDTTSTYVIAALNRFGEAGGMSPLAQRLRSGWAPFTEVSDFQAIWYGSLCLLGILSKPFIVKWVGGGRRVVVMFPLDRI